MSTILITGKPTPITEPRYPLFWFTTFSAASFNEIHLLSKDVITFIISFASLFSSFIPNHVIAGNFSLFFFQEH